MLCRAPCVPLRVVVPVWAAVFVLLLILARLLDELAQRVRDLPISPGRLVEIDQRGASCRVAHAEEPGVAAALRLEVADRSALLLGGRLRPVQAPASSTARSRTA